MSQATITHCDVCDALFVPERCPECCQLPAMVGPTPSSERDAPIAALGRLVSIARSDTGQASRVRSFVFSWYNALEFGGFDFSSLFSLDHSIVVDILRVVAFIPSRAGHYPSDYFPHEMRELVDLYPPRKQRRRT